MGAIILIIIVIFVIKLTLSSYASPESTVNNSSTNYNAAGTTNVGRVRTPLSSEHRDEALELVRRESSMKGYVHCPVYPLPKILGVLMEYCNRINESYSVDEKIGTLFWCNYDENYTIAWSTLEAIIPARQLAEALNKSGFSAEKVYYAMDKLKTMPDKLSKSELTNLSHYYYEYIIPMLYTYARFAEVLDTNNEYHSIISKVDDICFGY